MMRSLWSAVSGLNTHQTEMDVIGNNISNVNTTAFKSSATGFKDILYQTIRSGSAAGANRASTNTDQIGLGVRMGAISTNITKQGSAVNTDNPFDFMINGDVFFVVSMDSVSNVPYYTRDGGLTIDSTGTLVTKNNGYRLWYVEGEGTLGQTRDYVLISDRTKTIPGSATPEAYIKGNIDKDDPLLEDGKIVQLEVFGDDGATYTINFRFTDNDDGDDSTYGVSIDKILDQDGKRVKNSLTESLVLNYDRHNGTLQSITPNSQYTVDNGSKLIDDSGAVEETVFTMAGKVGNITFNRTVTGSDGNDYDITFQMTGIGDESTNYSFEIVGVKKKGDTATTQVDNQAITLDYDENTLKLNTINDEVSTLYTFDLSAQFPEIGKISFDFTDTSAVKEGGKSFQFTFSGDASVLGTIDVDFSSTSNYAGNLDGASTLNAYKGNKQGLNQGYAVGEMTGLSFTTNGEIYAKYSNGQTVYLCKLAFAEFSNPMGLESIGNNLYQASLNSGAARNVDLASIGASISSGVLEGSNVDLAKEFTDMITTQRGFQANSRVITTSDEMLQTVKSLKR